MTEREQILLELYNKLTEQDAITLVRFAEFLAGHAVSISSQPASEPAAVSPLSIDIPEPEQIARPAEERVVDALKRLSATYPMLEKKVLLNKASELVAQHVMFGKPAKQVIDETEVIFAAAYEKFVAEFKRG